MSQTIDSDAELQNLEAEPIEESRKYKLTSGNKGNPEKDVTSGNKGSPEEDPVALAELALARVRQKSGDERK